MFSRQMLNVYSSRPNVFSNLICTDVYTDVSVCVLYLYGFIGNTVQVYRLCFDGKYVKSVRFKARL